MAQFDVHASRGETARLAPSIVTLQAGLLADLQTVVVAPLHLPKTLTHPIDGLHLAVAFKGKSYLLAIEQLISLPRAVLGRPTGSLLADQAAIKRSIDLLFFGI